VGRREWYGIGKLGEEGMRVIQRQGMGREQGKGREGKEGGGR
jgi:hypothetical protein